MGRTKKTRGLAWLIILSMALTMCASLLLRGLSYAKAEKESSQVTPARIKASYPVLSRYATDLTRLARQGKLKLSAVNREYINQTIDVLSGTRHPVLIEDPNVNTREVA